MGFGHSQVESIDKRGNEWKESPSAKHEISLDGKGKKYESIYVIGMFLQVQYWDNQNSPSPVSEMAYFHFGISDWGKSTWLDGEKGNQLRYEFNVSSGQVVTAAHVYILGLGYYQLRLNGERVGDQVLGAFTTFERRLLYDTHDVTYMLREGPNAVAVTLGHGEKINDFLFIYLFIYLFI